MIPRTFVSFFVFLAMVVLSPTSALCQARSLQLLTGESVHRSLDGGDRHAYAVPLDSGQFLFATVEHVGIDIYLSVLDSTGSVVSVGEGPRGERGTESVALFTETAGNYWIAVLPRDESAQRGRYTITLERLEQTAADPGARVDQLFAAWDREGSPGAAVAVVRDGELVHASGYGMAHLEYDIPIDRNTVFHVASVSKQFTAFAILALANEGRLSLDDDIRAHLPNLPEFGHTITIRHLLHHTSGLRDQWSLLTMAGWRMDDVITRDQILRLVERQRELNFEPGAEYLYTNTGFTLLAEIVEQVTGQTFREWTAENIFLPLGMSSTHFHDDHRTLVSNRAYSYQYNPSGGYQKAVLSYATVGATSLFSTLEDLVRWTINFETGEVGGPGLIRQMRSRGALTNGDSLDYAMGQAIGSYRSLFALYHPGADAGYRAYVLRFPHHRVSVIVLANHASLDAGDMARTIAGFYLGDRFSPVEALSPEDGNVALEAALPDPANMSEFVGEYDLAPGVVMAISREGDQLFASTADQNQTTLVPLAPDRYLVEGSQQYIQFGRSASGVVEELRVEGPGSSVIAPRVLPFDPASLRLEDYVGDYIADELGTSYALEVQADTLTATHLRLGTITLVPRGTDTFVTNQWFIRSISFERDSTGQVTGFRASNDRVRRLLFLRR